MVYNPTNHMKSLTVVVDERFDQFTAVQFIILVSVMHLKIVKLQLLFAHFASIDWHLSMLLDMPTRQLMVNVDP